MSEAIENRLIDAYLKSYPIEVARLLEGLTSENLWKILKDRDPVDLRELLERLNPDCCFGVMKQMTPDFLRSHALQMDRVRLSHVISRGTLSEQEKILNEFPKPVASEIKEMVSYPLHCAGYLMDPRVTFFYEQETVEEGLTKIRSIKDRKVVDLYVVDADGKLEAKVSLQSMAVSQPLVPIASLMQKQPIYVRAMAAREEVVELLETYKLSSLPVVDAHHTLIGVIRYDALVAAVQQDAFADMQTMVGVSPEEKALSNVFFSVKKRLPWLTINLGTTFIAASVVSIFESTIAKVTALAVLLPIVAGQSGNTGAQSQAVAMRGLVLREIRLAQWVRLLLKELGVGLVNGLSIGILCALAVYFWSGSSGLALVIGASMVLAMLSASVFGAAIPVLLTAFKQDPAQSSSIILTTLTDVVGFLSFLGLASLFSKFLVVP